jgi:hypothetical protein
VFITCEITLGLGFPAASAGLAKRSVGAIVTAVSQDAYSEGSEELTGAGPVRCLPGALRLAGVRLGELSVQDTGARLPLRWEAAGPRDQGFPVLDADLTLAEAGEHSTVLRLTGTYRLPPGLAAAGFDQEAIGRCAARTAHGFLARLGCAISHPAGLAASATRPGDETEIPAGRIRTTWPPVPGVGERVQEGRPRPRAAASPRLRPIRAGMS